MSSETWRRNIPVLASRWRVLAPDLVGHGKSDRAENAPYSVRYYVDTMHEFLKLVNASNPVLIGHSLGGLIAIHLAMEDTAKETKALVLEDSAGLGGSPNFKMRMAFLSYFLRMSVLGASENRVRGWLKMGFYDDSSKISDESVKRALDSWKDSGYRRVQRKTALGLRKDERESKDLIDEILVPTLIVWGEKDKQIPVEVAYRAAARIKNCKVEVISNCGHAPHGECSEEFNSRVLSFLEGLG